MQKITKDMCINQTNSKWKSIFIYIITIEILGTLRICSDSDSIWLFVFCVVTFSIMTVFAYLLLRKSFHIVAKNSEFYLVEDVFINVQEKNAFANKLAAFNHGGLIGYRRLREYDFEIKFLRNGIHNVMIMSKKEPKEIDADYSAVFFSQPGDKFYLLMSKNPKLTSGNSKKDMIIKAFNAKYYKLVEEDFDYKDGKYYPKK